MRPEAVEAMLPYLTEHFGNPSGAHSISRAAKEAIEDAREIVADALGCLPGEVIFTGSGTEADNLAVAGAHGRRGGTVVCSAVEHHAVLHVCQALGGRIAPVCRDGVIDLQGLAAVLDESVSVVSVMLANNEVGTIQPLLDIVKLVRARAPGALVHTDAVQAFPWVNVPTAAAGADLIAVSAHKFGGPKGVGALAVRGGARLEPIVRGGGQERDLRSGTHNVAGIVAMAAAMRATAAERDAVVTRVGLLRDCLADGLLGAIPETTETGQRVAKVAGNCHLRFAGVESEALLVLLDDAGICASAGSACASGAMEPSHVLAAMGVPASEALTSIRLSLGSTSTAADVDVALTTIPRIVARLRKEG